MKVLTSCNLTQSRINNSFNRIVSNCDDSLKNDLLNMPLLVSDEIKVDEFYGDNPIFRKGYCKSFGATKGNILYKKMWYHLIVLNMKNIDKLELTESEFDGVFSHELGHIFNKNPQKEKLSYLKGHTKSQIESSQKADLLEKEIYADYFSKKTKIHEGLLSSIDKHLNSDFSINQDIFNTRVLNLNSKEEFIGTTLKINSLY